MRFPAVLALIAFVSPAFAQVTPPLGARHEVAGPRTEMLTLGSVHLSGHPDWQRGWLEPLIDRLAAWRPRVITVEQISGTQCEVLRTNPSLYGDAFDTCCRDATPFQASLRMSQAQAMTQALRTLASWPDAPSAPQRRHLAMLFLAADDPASAQVQWLRLPPTERHAGDGLKDAAVKVLAREGNRMNETYEIVAALAARLGLDRV